MEQEIELAVSALREALLNKTNTTRAVKLALENDRAASQSLSKAKERIREFKFDDIQ